MRILDGNGTIAHGELSYSGIDLRRATDRTMREVRGREISMIFQNPRSALNPIRKVGQQIEDVLSEHAVAVGATAKRRAIELLETVRIHDPEQRYHAYPHELSGGMCQRVVIALALACEPKVLIADEPTTALDVTTQIEVLAAIRDVVEQFDTAAMYITHDLAVVAQMADRIMVLRHGNLVEEGNARAMLANPREEYTRQLLSVRSFQKATAGDATQAPLLKVEGVTASYGSGPKVLDDVSIEIGHARTVAVVGESGSGKSTLARVITGLLPLSDGSVSYKGEVLPPRLKDRERGQLRTMQMIYQMPDTALNPKQRIREIIGRPLSFYLDMTGSKREERTRELLSLIELEPDDYIDRLPGELSGGQKQRICIARALAAEPELIICDEVTSALDQLVAEEVLKLLQRLQDDLRVSYMFITHDLATVRAIADDVVVMLQGKVVESGPKDEVMTPPHHDYTELLLSSVPEMDPDWLTRVLEARQANA